LQIQVDTLTGAVAHCCTCTQNWTRNCKKAKSLFRLHNVTALKKLSSCWIDHSRQRKYCQSSVAGWSATPRTANRDIRAKTETVFVL